MPVYFCSLWYRPTFVTVHGSKVDADVRWSHLWHSYSRCSSLFPAHSTYHTHPSFCNHTRFSGPFCFIIQLSWMFPMHYFPKLIESTWYVSTCDNIASTQIADRDCIHKHLVPLTQSPKRNLNNGWLHLGTKSLTNDALFMSWFCFNMPFLLSSSDLVKNFYRAP